MAIGSTATVLVSSVCDDKGKRGKGRRSRDIPSSRGQNMGCLLRNTTVIYTSLIAEQCQDALTTSLQKVTSVLGTPDKTPIYRSSGRGLRVRSVEEISLKIRPQIKVLNIETTREK